MSVRDELKLVFTEWNKEVFRDIHHEDFMFIRETELLTLDEHVENIDKLVSEEDFGKKFLRMAELVHENDYLTEWRWCEGGETVTAVILTKNGKAWRQIASRVSIENAA